MTIKLCNLLQCIVGNGDGIKSISSNLLERHTHMCTRRKRMDKEFRMDAQVGGYDITYVIFDLRSGLNII